MEDFKKIDILMLNLLIKKLAILLNLLKMRFYQILEGKYFLMSKKMYTKRTFCTYVDDMNFLNFNFTF